MSRKLPIVDLLALSSGETRFFLLSSRLAHLVSNCRLAELLTKLASFFKIFTNVVAMFKNPLVFFPGCKLILTRLDLSVTVMINYLGNHTYQLEIALGRAIAFNISSNGHRRRNRLIEIN